VDYLYESYLGNASPPPPVDEKRGCAEGQGKRMLFWRAAFVLLRATEGQHPQDATPIQNYREVNVKWNRETPG
jgi:hypothetical protein